MTNGVHPDPEPDGVPGWRYSAKGPTYVLITTSHRCLVWQTTRGPWGAVVNHAGTSTAAYNFDTADAAKAWCEQQVAYER